MFTVSFYSKVTDGYNDFCYWVIIRSFDLRLDEFIMNASYKHSIDASAAAAFMVVVSIKLSLEVSIERIV